MSGLDLVRRALSMPPDVAARKAVRRVGRELRDWRDRRRERIHPTYRSGESFDGPLSQRLGRVDPAPVIAESDVIFELAERAMAHEFDLLGSGWTRVERKGPPSVNPANRAESERIAALLPKDYRPIDWHVDWKSGHRWPADVWAGSLDPTPGDGVDVKVPWELSRMQHLPVLAWAAALAEAREAPPAPRPAAMYRSEFRAQILDFIAHNPPHFGVNFVCAMDVAIRMAGWLLAWDLARALGTAGDDAFDGLLSRSVHEHARFVVNHLEWDERVRGNHYLADVSGLAIAAAYLPPTAERDRWLGFAAREWSAEVKHQFHPDGSNFEASTGYHRLGAEMALWPAAVLQASTPDRLDALLASDWPGYRPGPPSATLARRSDPTGGPSVLDPVLLERIDRMGRFTSALIDSDGEVDQIGDHDSGRFVKLWAAWSGPPGQRRENCLDHHHLPASCAAFFPNGPGGVEAGLLRGLLGEARAERAEVEDARPERYPGMGLSIHRVGPLTLVLRCGGVGQDGNGGHAHCDQLSLTAMLDGRWLLIDPGTGVYTPDPGLCNRMRSVHAHNTLALDGAEQGRWLPGRAGLFQMTDLARAEVLECSERRWAGRHRAWSEPHERTVEILEDRVVIRDRCAAPGVKTVRLHVHPDARVELEGQEAVLERGGATLRASFEAATLTIEEAPYSPAYGELGSCRVLSARLAGDAAECRLSW